MKRSLNIILSSLVLVVSLFTLTPTFAFAQTSIQGSASLNWSGYVSQNQGTYTSVTGTWIVPAVSAATSGTADATWVGIGGISSHDLIQAGTQALVQGGTVTYNAWVEALPGYSQTISLPVHSGDSITATLNQESAGVWRYTIVNNTTGQSYSATKSYTSTLSSAEWVEEMVSNTNGTFRPLDNFGTVSFINASATVSGVNKNLSQIGATPLQMVNGTGQTLATVSALNGDGAGFTASRSTAVASSVVPTVVGGRVGRSGWRVINTATSTSAQPAPATVTYVVRRGVGRSAVQYQAQATSSNTITIGGFTFTIIRM